MLATHDDVGSAIALAELDGDFRHGRLAVGVEQFRSVGDDSAIFLLGSREESRHIDQRDDRNVERVAEAHETGTLA